MSCAYVRRAFNTGYRYKETNRPIYIFTKSDINFVHKPRPMRDELGREMYYYSSDDAKTICHNALELKAGTYYSDVRLTEFVEIPCGDCEQCKAKRSREWAERCMAESTEYKYNQVINLTYNNENLPYNEFIIDSETGERIPSVFNSDDNIRVPTLKYSDVVDFKKRLQRHFDYHYGEQGIRFLVAGEYGETTKRPHYHIIAFNLNIRDLVDNGYTKNGSKEYLSATIQKLWKKGNVTIGEVNQASIQYISNYCLKKIKALNVSTQYYHDGREKEFIRTSTMPGIGHKWLMEHADELYENGVAYIGTDYGVREIRSSRYLDRKQAELDELRVNLIKESRKNLIMLREQTRATLSGVDIDTQRKNDARLFHERIKSAKVRSKL